MAEKVTELIALVGATGAIGKSVAAALRALMGLFDPFLEEFMGRASLLAEQKR